MFYNHKTGKCIGKIHEIKKDDPHMEYLREGAKSGRIICLRTRSEEEIIQQIKEFEELGIDLAEETERVKKQMVLSGDEPAYEDVEW